MVKHSPSVAKICLIHGPPGTGKSKTIVGLLYRLLTEVECVRASVLLAERVVSRELTDRRVNNYYRSFSPHFCVSLILCGTVSEKEVAEGDKGVSSKKSRKRCPV